MKFAVFLLVFVLIHGSMCTSLQKKKHQKPPTSHEDEIEVPKADEKPSQMSESEKKKNPSISEPSSHQASSHQASSHQPSSHQPSNHQSLSHEPAAGKSPSHEKQSEAEDNYSGPNEFDLLEALMDQTSCSYRIEAYWTYELCHGRHLRQYHEEKEMGKKSRLQEYFLGRFDRVVGKEEARKETESKPKSRTKRVESMEVPFYEQVYTDGTLCDLSSQPRLARLHYTCHLEGRGEIYEIKETSSCEYEVVILTSLLCSHPKYAPPKEPTNTIQCHALSATGSAKPLSLLALEAETQNRFNKYQGDNYERIHKKQTSTFYQKPAASQAPAAQPAAQTQTNKPAATQKPPTASNTQREDTIGALTDKQVIRDFLAGTFCIKGGTGWWKHEFCYGKRVTQYHEEKSTGMVTVALGTWDKQAHTMWLVQNPNKQPKQNQRKSVSQFYGNGDLCELTGKPRFTEVKLKCKENPSHPHAMAIYLVEPNTCEYIVVVESPLLCPLIEMADQDGLLPTTGL